jgi:hypothetical protein
LIGQKCKPGNRFSRLVLIGRGLHHKHIRVHCATPEQRKTHPHHKSVESGTVKFKRVTAAIAAGKRPDPFRTRKLSPPAPMVLHWRRCGRVGRRRTNTQKSGDPHGSPLSASPNPIPPTHTSTPRTPANRPPPPADPVDLGRLATADREQTDQHSPDGRELASTTPDAGRSWSLCYRGREQSGQDSPDGRELASTTPDAGRSWSLCCRGREQSGQDSPDGRELASTTPDAGRSWSLCCRGREQTDQDCRGGGTTASTGGQRSSSGGRPFAGNQ